MSDEQLSKLTAGFVLGDEAGEALELLCNKYGARVSMNADGVDEAVYAHLVTALVPKRVYVAWSHMSDGEIALSLARGQNVSRDVLIFRGVR